MWSAASGMLLAGGGALAMGVSYSEPAAAASAASQDVDIAGLQWDLEEDSRWRWRVQVEVNLPSFLWVYQDRGPRARIVAYQIDTVIDCWPVHVRARKAELVCEVEDAMLSGAAADGDRGLLQPILDEADDKLTGSQMQVILKRDGRLVNFDLEEVDRRDVNRRTTLMNEKLRLLVARAIAGFDLQLPRGGQTAGELWTQYDAMLMLAPSQAGSYASSQLVHRVIESGESTVLIETAGRGTMSSAEAEDNLYDTELRSLTVFDLEAGGISERLWSVYGEPTAGSAISEGYEGIPYVQWGRITPLDPGESPELGETLEVSPPGRSVSTLQMWQPLGLNQATVGGRMPSQ